MWFILQAENFDIRFKFNCQITYMMFEILKTIIIIFFKFVMVVYFS